MDPFECCICLTDMLDRTPRCLHCLHTFCTECLQALIVNNTIKCPTCRELTQLKSGEVTELKVDFKLAQMRDLREKAPPVSGPSSSVGKVTCQICQHEDAAYKCKDCLEVLCLSCKKNHDEFDHFKGHSVLELCQKNQDGVPFICVECVLPLCKRCLMLDHLHHKNHCVTYNEGVEKIQQNVKSAHENIKQEIKNKDEACSESKANFNKDDEILLKLLKQREKRVEEIEEIDKLLLEREERKTKFMNEEKQYAECKTECTVAAASLSSLLGSPVGFCQKYGKLKQKADRALERIKEVNMDYKLPVYDATQPCDCKITKPRPMADPIQNLEVEKLVLDLQRTGDFKPGSEITYFEDDVVLCSGNRVIRMNKAGKVVDRYYLKEQGDVNGVQVFEGKVYIAQSNAITVVTPGGLSLLYKPDVENIDKILVLNKTSIVISNNRNPGKIVEFNTEQNKAVTLVDGLNQPKYMDKMKTEDGDRYIVSEYGASRISVYDQGWKQLHQFGEYGEKDGQMCFPYATVTTNMNTVLVADNNNYRVSHYTIDGRFLSQVITGLYWPAGLAYKMPYLWVCRPDYVKCYKLKSIN